MDLKDRLIAAARAHQDTELGTLLQAAAQDREQLYDIAECCNKAAKQALDQMEALSLCLHELGNELTTLLVLHIEGDPVRVCQRLDVLAARYVRSAGSQSLQAMAAAAGKVH